VTGEATAARTVVVQQAPQRLWSPGVAAVLSLVIPGAGQMYKGQIGNGIVWLIGTVIGYFLFIVPGLLLHLLCIVGAAKGNPYAEQRSVGGQVAEPAGSTPTTVPAKGHFGCPGCGKTVRAEAGLAACPHCGQAFGA
jgi:TM2 domain-containing membrane protein YozV